jgi:acyl carrier protein
MQALEQELKVLIIETLNLEDVTPNDIESEHALFGDGLGLDSIDALELGLALRKGYGITMSADSAENRKHFASVKALAEFVAAERTI